MYRHVKALSLRCSVESGNNGPTSKRRRTSSRSQDEEVVFTVSRAVKMFTRVIFVMLGFRAGAVVKALPFHQSNPGLMPAQCHMWGGLSLLLVLAFSESFSLGSLVFLRPKKEYVQIPI